MLTKTHLSISVFFAMIFLSKVDVKILFLFAVVFASFIPDIDIRFSKFGKKKIFRPLQFLAGHRGIFHSFIFLGLVCFGIYFFNESIALGFFLGYGLHIIGDCFTKSGVKLFYPFEFKLRGFVKTGGLVEAMIFVLFLILDLGLIVEFFIKMI